MEHNARKPAIVVSEDPITDLNVALMAFAIATFLSGSLFFSVSYL